MGTAVDEYIFKWESRLSLVRELQSTWHSMRAVMEFIGLCLHATACITFLDTQGSMFDFKHWTC